jgi:hypothetical protein
MHRHNGTSIKKIIRVWNYFVCRWFLPRLVVIRASFQASCILIQSGSSVGCCCTLVIFEEPSTEPCRTSKAWSEDFIGSSKFSPFATRLNFTSPNLIVLVLALIKSKASLDTEHIWDLRNISSPGSEDGGLILCSPRVPLTRWCHP